MWTQWEVGRWNQGTWIARHDNKDSRYMGWGVRESRWTISGETEIRDLLELWDRIRRRSHVETYGIVNDYPIKIRGSDPLKRMDASRFERSMHRKIIWLWNDFTRRVYRRKLITRSGVFVANACPPWTLPPWWGVCSYCKCTTHWVSGWLRYTRSRSRPSRERHGVRSQICWRGTQISSEHQ